MTMYCRAPKDDVVTFQSEKSKTLSGNNGIVTSTDQKLSAKEGLRPAIS